MRSAVAILALFALSGCITEGDSTPATMAAQAAPSTAVSRDQAQKAILAERTHYWKDPGSIRDARISDPLICPSRNNLFPANATCVCIEANAKNSYGGYTGLHRTIWVFLPGGGTTTSDGGEIGFQDICNSLAPFPALNAKS